MNRGAGVPATDGAFFYAPKAQRKLAQGWSGATKAVATEYKESLDIENDPQKKEKWLTRQKGLADRQLKMDALQFSVPDAPETDANDEGA